MRQRDAVAEHGADDGFTLDNRFQKLRADKTFPFKLPAQFAEQRLLVDRLVENAEMGRVEVFSSIHGRVRSTSTSLPICSN